METSLPELIGAKIRLHRSTKNWTQEQLAEAIGSTASYIGQLERGEKNAKLHTIEKIVHALDMSIHHLFENEQEPYLQSKKWAWDSLMLILQQNENNQRKAYRILRELFSSDDIE